MIIQQLELPGRVFARRALQFVGGVRALITVLCLGLIFVVAGCYNATEIAGVNGVTVDAQNRPVLLVVVCRGYIDGVNVYGAHQGDDKTKQQPIGRWESALKAAGQQRELPVLSPSPPGWTVIKAPPMLREGVSYAAIGFTNDTKWEARQLNFTLAQLAGLSPGQVLYENQVTSREHFNEEACRGL